MSIEFCAVCDPRLFVLDMEWLGDVTQPNTTLIYSIAVIHCATGNVFTQIVDPGLTAPQLRGFKVYEGCRKVTRSWLKREKAVGFAKAFRLLIDFVEAFCPSSQEGSAMDSRRALPPLLAAHGAHRADKPVLVSAMRRTGTPFPTNWRWVDTLHFFRRVLPPFRTVGYSLHEIAKSVGVNYESFGRPHDALPDATTLLECLKVFPHIYGANYGWHETALTTVPGVGLRTETTLFQHNIRSTEQLLTFAVHCCFHSCATQTRQPIPVDRALHRPCTLHTTTMTPNVLRTTSERPNRHGLEKIVTDSLRCMGIERAGRIAKWCVDGVCIFSENASV